MKISIKQKKIKTKVLEDFKDLVLASLIEGAEVHLDKKDNTLIDKHSNVMYKVTSLDDAVFGVSIEGAYSFLHEQIKRLMLLANASSLIMDFRGGDSKDFSLEITLIHPYAVIVD